MQEAPRLLHRTRHSNPFRSASLATRDILFRALGIGRKSRRTPAFPPILPNHGHRPRSPLRAVSRLSPAPFSDTTEARPFWYGCWKLGKLMR
jgi:hypothetical protein